MPYVSRDENGRISGISDRQTELSREFLESGHPEVMAFIEGATPDSMRQRLSVSDSEMARITEDLIEVLIARNVINFTDLPATAQRKLVARQRLRRNMTALSNLVSDSDDIF